MSSADVWFSCEPKIVLQFPTRVCICTGPTFRAYFFDDKQHHEPHVHVEYADSQAVMNILDGNILAGELPASQTKLARAWLEIHKDELMANWKLATNGNELFKIDPLR